VVCALSLTLEILSTRHLFPMDFTFVIWVTKVDWKKICDQFISDTLLNGTRYVVAIVSVHLLLFIWFVVQTVTLADQLVNYACHMIGLSSVTFHGFT
jgi:hypothetical protein